MVLLDQLIAFAAESGTVGIPCGVAVNGVIENPCDYADFLILIGNIFRYLTLVAVPLATAAIVYGGVLMVISAGNDGKRSEAKGIIKTAITGLVIILASYLIVKTIFNALVTDSFKALFP
ncbi:MAG: hypothetical protein AAB455_00755 [Patescibacteria group bacterium]